MRIGEIIREGVREPEVPDWQHQPVTEPQPKREREFEPEKEPEKV